MKDIITNTNKFMSRTGLKIKKYSPEILMVTGIVGTVASTVLACKATTKISVILDEKKNTINSIHECLADEKINYTEEDSKKDLTIVYAQTGVKLAKLYLPSAILGTLSITSIVAGHNILKKRNVALAAAYAVVDRGFKDYRKNVVDRFGNDLDRELRYNIKAKEIEETVIDKKGKEKVEKKIVNTIDSNTVSPYAKFFDEYCMEWTKDPEYNLMYLRKQQDYANDKLKSQGHLFLNEVYDALGINRTKEGQVVGWIYDEKNPIGDNYVDFGIYNIKNEANRLFVNGNERSILLDFNVDGPIYELI